MKRDIVKTIEGRPRMELDEEIENVFVLSSGVRYVCLDLVGHAGYIYVLNDAHVLPQSVPENGGTALDHIV